MTKRTLTEEGGQEEAVEPGAYTEEYFRSSVEGHEEFAASGGREVSARMVRALDLANPKPGGRALDVGCGRGEMVLQSALRGSYAVGIDYANASMTVAGRSLGDAGESGRTALARMDATRLAFRPATFDLAFMLDFVEHVPQRELEQAFREVARALKAGGKLVVHTSPNRVFEDAVYRHYVRNVHRIILGVARPLGLHKGRLLNPMLLPTGPVPPHDEYERRLHVNPQSSGSLRGALQRSGFRVRRVDYWEPPPGPFFGQEMRWHNFWLGILDAVRFLRPLSRLPPLSRFFSNHIWVVAERE